MITADQDLCFADSTATDQQTYFPSKHSKNNGIFISRLFTSGLPHPAENRLSWTRPGYEVETGMLHSSKVLQNVPFQTRHFDKLLTYYFLSIMDFHSNHILQDLIEVFLTHIEVLFMVIQILFN